MDTISATMLSQELILMVGDSPGDWVSEWRLSSLALQGSRKGCFSCQRACCTQNQHPGLAFYWQKSEEPYFCPAALCTTGHACTVIMHSFSESCPPPTSSPFCSVTAQGPRTVEIWPAGVLFLTLHTSQLRTWPPRRCIHSRCFFLSEDADRKPMPVPGVEGAWEAGDPVVVSQPPGLPSSAHCRVQHGNTAIHKRDIHVCGTPLWACFIPW